MSTRRELNAEPLFILHRKCSGDDSLLLDCLTHHYGRLTVFAQGARRFNSVFGQALLPFQPLIVSCSGNNLLRLNQVSYIRVFPFLDGRKLWAALYMNELIINFLPREDAAVDLFSCYCDALEHLVYEKTDFFDAILRRFEINLLNLMGYSINFREVGDGRGCIHPDGVYTYIGGSGLVPLDASPMVASPVSSGQALIDLSEGRVTVDKAVEIRQLMRYILDYYLDGYSLKTRQILQILVRKDGW